MYVTFSIVYISGQRSNCIARYPSNLAISTSVLDHPHSLNCITTAESAEPSRIIGKIDYFDKAVAVMSNYVYNPFFSNPTPDYGTNTVMTFVGQCSLDQYYKIDFDTKKYVVGELSVVVAYSSTVTYIYHFSMLRLAPNMAKAKPVMYRVFFDPDTTACSTGGYKT